MCEALAWAEKGKAVAGVVYVDDARTSHQVTVITEFSADSHPPLVHSGAVPKGHQTAQLRMCPLLPSLEISL